jgi:hypothetical protein
MLRELYAAPAAPLRPKKNHVHLPAYPLSDQQLKAGTLLSAGMQEQIKAVFEILDTDNSGTVDEEELAEAMFALGLTREGSGHDDIEQLLGTVTADYGKSSAIDLAKFSAIMQVPKFCPGFFCSLPRNCCSTFSPLLLPGSLPTHKNFPFLAD